MSKALDLARQQFGHWTALRRDRQRSVGGRTYWWCECDQCGSEQSVRRDSLRAGTSTQCRACADTDRTMPQSGGRVSQRRARAKALRAEGLTYPQIARKLGCTMDWAFRLCQT